MYSISPPRCARLAAALATSFCLVLSAGCSTVSPTIAPRLPPPADLAQPCDAGPPFPEADVSLDVWQEVITARELAAADCRRRQRGLAAACLASPQ